MRFSSVSLRRKEISSKRLKDSLEWTHARRNSYENTSTSNAFGQMRTFSALSRQHSMLSAGLMPDDRFVEIRPKNRSIGHLSSLCSSMADALQSLIIFFPRRLSHFNRCFARLAKSIAKRPPLPERNNALLQRFVLHMRKL